MYELNETQKANFLQFCTGTSKVPLGGFANLVGIGGKIRKFNIHRTGAVQSLPISHTCFNQLDLPEYPSKELLKKMLLISITEGKEGFSFA